MTAIPEQKVTLTLEMGKALADLEKIKSAVMDLVDLDMLADLVIERIQQRVATKQENLQPSVSSQKPVLKLVRDGEDSPSSM